MPDPQHRHWNLRAPQTPADWQSYYALRWRVLRAPWKQPPGSEQDDLDHDGVHRLVCDAQGTVVAVGRLHRLDSGTAQIRYMAVEPALERQGLGSLILRALEGVATESGVRRIVLHARQSAIPFYLRHGYTITGPSHLLYGCIQHSRMEKSLPSPDV